MAEELPKKTIGYYDLDKNIGEGNFAKVRLGTHTLTGEKVAVKIIDKEKLDKATAKKLFREVRIMKMLNHDNVIRLYEVIDTPTELYLVLEYVSGGEVFDYLVAHGRMKEKDARKHFRQIIGAVAYCHSMHIIHRDLKAENLLFDAHMNVKVADFGFANNFTPGTQLNTWCGSPPYAAPELFQGKEYAGPEVDIWSLGVVLYVLVCGSLPFDGSTLPKLRARVIAGKFKVPFYMSPDCERLVKRMLTIEPNKRATMQNVMEDKWYIEGYENESNVIIPGIVLTAAQHDAVMQEMEAIGMDVKIAAQSLKDDVYDSHAATYYLLADRRFRQKIPFSIANTDSSAPQHKRAQTQPAKKVEQVPVEEEEENDTVAEPKKIAEGGSKVPVRARRATTGHAAVPGGPEPITQPVTVVVPPANNSKEALPPTRNAVTATRVGSGSKPAAQVAAVPPAQPTALPPIQVRKTTMTGDEPAPVSITEAKKNILQEVQRFTVSLATTTTRDPLEVHGDIIKILDLEGIKHGNAPVINCKVENLEFELEVVKVPNLAVYCLRFKRLSGSTWGYKDVMTKLISKLNLQEQ